MVAETSAPAFRALKVMVVTEQGDSAARSHETGCPEMTNAENSEPVVQLIPTRSDAEIAEDLKRRLMESLKPVLEIFDEAAAAGLAIQWESIAPQSPRYKHEVKGLRIVKYL